MNSLLGFFSIVLLCHSAYTAQISQGCQVNLQNFVNCARPNFPNFPTPNQAATDAAVHCFVDNGCVDPTCVREEMKQVLPQALQDCSGIDVTKMQGGSDSDNGAGFARIAMANADSDMKDEGILRMCNGDQGKQSTVKSCLQGVQQNYPPPPAPTVNMPAMFMCAMQSGMLQCKDEIRASLCACVQDQNLRTQLENDIQSKCNMQMDDSKLDKMAQNCINGAQTIFQRFNGGK